MFKGAAQTETKNEVHSEIQASLILDDIGIYWDMLGMFQCLLIAVCSFCIMRCGNPWEGPTHQRMLQQAIGMKIKIPSFDFSLTHPL